MRYGFWLILISLLLISGLFVFVVWLREVPFRGVADVHTGLGTVTTLFGTLVGLFFGHQAGSSGREKAEAARKHSDAVANAALAHLDDSKVDDMVDDIQRMTQSE